MLWQTKETKPRKNVHRHICRKFALLLFRILQCKHSLDQWCFQNELIAQHYIENKGENLKQSGVQSAHISKEVQNVVVFPFNLLKVICGSQFVPETHSSIIWSFWSHNRCTYVESLFDFSKECFVDLVVKETHFVLTQNCWVKTLVSQKWSEQIVLAQGEYLRLFVFVPFELLISKVEKCP